MIPARGNYLLVGAAYSLGGYAAGDQTIAADIEADRNVALFNTSDATAFGSTTVVDAVGFGANTGGNCDLLREGNTLTGAANDASQYSFVREVEQGATADSGDSAADFALVSTTPAVLINGVTPLLGAPGPESSTKPRGPVPCAANPTYKIGRALLDPTVDAGAEPNRKRDATPDVPNNSTLGTIEFRRTFTNNTGGSLTALRFRIVDLTTLNSPARPAGRPARAEFVRRDGHALRQHDDGQRAGHDPRTAAHAVERRRRQLDAGGRARGCRWRTARASTCGSSSASSRPATTASASSSRRCRAPAPSARTSGF